MGGFVRGLRRLGSRLSERPEVTATGIGAEEVPPSQEDIVNNLQFGTPAAPTTRLGPVSSTVQGAPAWVSGVGDFLTALGGGPEAAQRQQALRQRHLQSLAQQAIAPQVAEAQAAMESRKFANEELKVKLAQKSAERDRWERVTDAATGKTVFWDKDRIGQPGYLPVPVNLRDVTPEGIQKTAESFRKIVGEKTWLDRHFQAGLSAAQQEAENSGLEKPITDYIKTWAGKDFDTSGGTEFERAFSVQHGRKPTADELKRFRKESGQGQVTSEINQLRADLLRMQMSGQLTGEQRLKAIFELRQLATKRATDFDDLENFGRPVDEIMEQEAQRIYGMSISELRGTPQAPKPAGRPLKPISAHGAQPIFARNPQTGQRIMSTDGGKTWAAAPAQ